MGGLSRGSLGMALLGLMEPQGSGLIHFSHGAMANHFFRPRNRLVRVA